jgi:hypothetical protein
LFVRPNEGDPPAVRRPHRQIFVEFRIGGQLLALFAVDIEQVQVPPAPRRKISVFILLEMQRVDHDGFGRRARGASPAMA